ncbi:hypothetical protein OKW39_002034 [Paraburkholderia sp. MM6662-R1]
MSVVGRSATVVNEQSDSPHLLHTTTLVLSLNIGSTGRVLPSHLQLKKDLA